MAGWNKLKGPDKDTRLECLMFRESNAPPNSFLKWLAILVIEEIVSNPALCISIRRPETFTISLENLNSHHWEFHPPIVFNCI